MLVSHVTDSMAFRTYSELVRWEGPPSTRVVYALTAPIVVPIILDRIPRPVHTPLMLVDDHITNGYVRGRDRA